MKYIECSNQKVVFNGDLLFNIKDLAFLKGDKVAIIGRNGVGKTSLIKLLIHLKSSYIKGDFFYLPQYYMNKSNRSNKSGGENQFSSLIESYRYDYDYYIFDEPLVNLDERNKKVFYDLINKLNSYIVISHDRKLIREKCNVIWEIENNELNIYRMEYDDYIQEKRREKKEIENSYSKYVHDRNKLESSIRNAKVKSQKYGRKSRNMNNSEKKASEYSSIGRSHSTKQKSSSRKVKVLESKLEKLEHVKEPEEDFIIKPTVILDKSFKTKKKKVIVVDRLNFSYEENVIFDDASCYFRYGTKTALVGENGCGKTTLLDQIFAQYKMGLYNREVRVHNEMKIGYLSQMQRELDDKESVIEFIRRESCVKENISRTILDRMGFDRESINKKIEVLSGGERIKLCISTLLIGRYNLLLLDEINNYLDIESIISIEKFLKSYEGAVIFASHDSTFIKNVATNIIRIEKNKLVTI